MQTEEHTPKCGSEEQKLFVCSISDKKIVFKQPERSKDKKNKRKPTAIAATTNEKKIKRQPKSKEEDL